MIKVLRNSCSPLMVAVSLLASGNAQTTPVPADDTPDADVLVVTAQRREQNIQDVPIAVTAVDARTLQDNQIRDIQDVALLAPSLSFTQSSNQLQSGLRLRGIGTQVFSQTVEPSVSFVVDGVVIARQGQALTNLIDIERVEVLRGPQGTLFGKNASAGVVNVITKQPTNEFEGEVLALYAEDGEVDLKGTIAGPLTENVWGRITAFTRDRPGHIENVFDGRDLNGNASSGVRGQLKFVPSDNVDIRVIADYTKSTADCCQWQPRSIGTASGQPEPNAFRNRIAPVVANESNKRVNVRGDVQADAEDWGLSTEINYDIPGHVITSITAYRSWDFQNNTDVDSTPLNVGGIVFDRNGNDQQNTQFTQEIRLTSLDNERFEYILGLYYFNLGIDAFFERDLTFNVTDTIIVPVQTIRNDNRVDTTNISAFADVTWNISDRFKAFGGARIIREEIEFTTSRDNFIGGPRVYDFERNADDTGFAGRAGVQFAATDDIDLYASYARSYKGLAVETAATAPLSFLEQKGVLDPETGNAFEIGAKTSHFDNRLRLGVAVFHSTYDDFQAQALNPDTALSELFNVGTIETSGVEIDFTAAPVDGLSLSGGIAYVNAEIDQFANAPCFAGQPEGTGFGQCDRSGAVAVANVDGGDLPNAPDWKINLNARYDVPVDGNFEPFVQGSVVWQDEVLFGIAQDPDTVQDAYAMVNVSAGMTISSVTATIFVRNLFDQSYAANIFQTPFGDNFGNSHYIPRDAERYVGGTLGVRF